jgi:hypothetical protein
MADGTKALAPPRAAAVAGVLFAVLMTASIIIARLSWPHSRAEVQEWLNDPARRNAARFAVHLAPFAGIAFLWFIGVIRNRLGDLEDRFFATVFFGSGLLFVASLFASAAFSGSLLDSVDDPGASVNSEGFFLARRLATAFLNVFAVKMASVFTMSASTIMLRTGILPRWVAYSGFASAAVLLFIITNWAWIALLFPLWILIVSACILVETLRTGTAPKVSPAAGGSPLAGGSRA